MFVAVTVRRPGFAGACRTAAAVLASVGLALVVFPAGVARAQPAPAISESSLETLEISTANGSHRFSVEVMRNDEQRARGLMHRRFMPADRGMLFDFKKEEHVSMWMKNTFIPLDMLFVDRTGKIVSIAENTEPLSERVIPSGGPVLAVLELNAGISRKLGIKAGDRLKHSLFK
ncbi:MAG: DUF192 domain-containing protein [Beijerinckiaceae bacterium]|nr:DUF192 domain-containing protein [Beijerinckiaceae bacterium]